MIKTSYVCDKCGAVQDTPEQFWNVGVTYSNQGATYIQYSTPAHKNTMQVCRKCFIDFGLTAPTKKDEPIQQAPPTLEELIREIVREEINA